MAENNQKIENRAEKSNWWLWACLGCFILFIIFIIISGFIGFKVYKEFEKNIVDQEGNQNKEPQYQEYQEAEEKILSSSEYDVVDIKTYRVSEKISLNNSGRGDASRIDLRMAMIKNINPYQEVESEDIKSVTDPKIIGDDYNNKYAYFEIPGLAVGEEIAIETNYIVKVNSIKYVLGDCTGDSIDGFKSSEKYIEADNQAIIDKAGALKRGDKSQCQTTKDIYNYVADNVHYGGYIPEDQGALYSFNNLAGDCTNFTDLFIGLARAAEIPARFLEGLGYTENAQTPADVKHDWAEAYLPGVGWTQVDPTWGRYENSRNLQFARTDGAHIIMTKGRNLDILNDAHYFAYNYWWEGEEAQVDYDEDWQVELVE